MSRDNGKEIYERPEKLFGMMSFSLGTKRELSHDYDFATHMGTHIARRYTLLLYRNLQNLGVVFDFNTEPIGKLTQVAPLNLYLAALYAYEGKHPSGSVAPLDLEPYKAIRMDPVLLNQIIEEEGQMIKDFLDYIGVFFHDSLVEQVPEIRELRTKEGLEPFWWVPREAYFFGSYQERPEKYKRMLQERRR